MYREMTPKEVRESDKRLQKLQQSALPEDQLCAILMDTKCGSFGLYEETAREKAKAILKWMNKRSGKTR